MVEQCANCPKNGHGKDDSILQSGQPMLVHPGISEDRRQRQQQDLRALVRARLAQRVGDHVFGP